eukprot:gnl/Trimastix_PCT/1841.p1 GENE.gnl/Trimastix_PCT/1841~~gnl/Trimastix_PCT/1841.p1  ORF type:complete len:476 (-),score=102.37 gnl/Trimastix_PCT/1841:188-1615(-)
METNQRTESQQRREEFRIGNKYRLIKRIGRGSFGDIYKAFNITTGEEVAVKLEPVRTRQPQLYYETRLYRVLSGGLGIPYVRWFGIEGPYNVMVMDHLGLSLEDLFNRCGRRFTLKTVLMIADQLITRVEYLHSKNFIHRDIKPDNFLIGRGKKENIIYMIDLGLAKRYRDNRTHQHISYRDGKGLTGTVRYASINAHLGVEQSRRDDLESLGYVFIYFLAGSLPWQGLRTLNKRLKYKRIGDIKMGTPVEMLCNGFPTEFCTYLNYARGLRFDAKPDYSYLRKLFRDLFFREGYQYDYDFDWCHLRRAPDSRHGHHHSDRHHERRHHGGEETRAPAHPEAAPAPAPAHHASGTGAGEEAGHLAQEISNLRIGRDHRGVRDSTGAPGAPPPDHHPTPSPVPSDTLRATMGESGTSQRRWVASSSGQHPSGTPSGQSPAPHRLSYGAHPRYFAGQSPSPAQPPRSSQGRRYDFLSR